MRRTDCLPKKQRHSKTATRIIALVEILALQFLFVPPPARGASRAQEQARQPLGSFNAVGEVYVNDAPSPAEGTIFSGDTLRTGANGTAAFTPSGRGTLKISPRSQLVFAGIERYLAELKTGTAVMSTQGGAAGVSLRAGNFVIVAVTEGEQSTASVESATDGSFAVNCLEGSLGVLPLQEGANGLFLQPGQAVNISPQGELSAAKQPAAPSSASAPPPAPGTKVKKSNTGWILLLVAGGVAAGAGAALGKGGSSGQPVSPAVP